MQLPCKTLFDLIFRGCFRRFCFVWMEDWRFIGYETGSRKIVWKLRECGTKKSEEVFVICGIRKLSNANKKEVLSFTQKCDLQCYIYKLGRNWFFTYMKFIVPINNYFFYFPSIVCDYCKLQKCMYLFRFLFKYIIKELSTNLFFINALFDCK